MNNKAYYGSGKFYTDPYDSVTPFPCEYTVEPFNNACRLAMFIDCPKGTDWDTLAKASV